MRLLAEIALITLAAIGVAVCVIVIPRDAGREGAALGQITPAPGPAAQARAPC